MSAELKKLAEEFNIRGYSNVGKMLEGLANGLLEAKVIPETFEEIKQVTSTTQDVRPFDEVDLPALSQKLRTKREENGMSQTALSRKAGIGRTTIWKVERGQDSRTGNPVKPSLDKLMRWTEALKMNENETLHVMRLSGYSLRRGRS